MRSVPLLFNILAFLLLSPIAFGQSSTSYSLADLEKKALESNPEFQSMQATIESKRSLSDAAASSYYPSLSATGGLGETKTLEEKRQGYVGYLTGKWNLYRGGRDFSVRDEAHAETRIAELKSEIKRRELLLSIRSQYYSLIALDHLLKIENEEKGLSEDQRRMAQKKVKAGLTSSVDDIEFELREGEIAIQMRSLSAERERILAEMKKNLGIETQIEVIGTLPLSNQNFEKKEAFLRDHPLNKLSLEEISLIDARKREVKSEYFPEVDFSASYGRLTLDDTSIGRWNETQYLLSVTIPLFSGFDTFHKMRAATFEVTQKERERVSVQQTLEKEFDLNFSRYSELRDLSEMNEKRIARAKQYYTMTIAEYKRGIKNSPDLVSATERLFEIQKKQIEILRDLQILKTNLELMASN